MIIVTLVNSSYCQQFEELLKLGGYIFKKRLSRIYCIEVTQVSFTHKELAYIESIVDDQQIQLKSQYIDTQDANIVVHKQDIQVAGLKNWGRHRVIRRNNPFYKDHHIKNAVTFNLPFRQTRTGVGVDIYIVDMGMTCDHDEMGGRARDVTSDNPTYRSQSTHRLSANSHALACSGAAAGSTVGVATGASIYFQETNIAFASTTSSSLLDYYDEMYQHYLSRSGTNRPAIVSNSYLFAADKVSEGTSNNALLPVVAAINDCIDVGMVWVFAAGNYRENYDAFNFYPQEVAEEIVVVGGTNHYDMPMFGVTAYGSGIGNNVDIYAPAFNLMLPIGKSLDGSNWDSTTSYQSYNGTSFACPTVCGVLACMLEGYQRLTTRGQVASLKQKLLDNSTKNKLKLIKHFISPYQNAVVHNRLVYLDPTIAFEEIQGLNPL